MISQLFRIKSLDKIKGEAEAQPENRLKKSLGAIDLVSLGVGAVIGAGIFVGIGTAISGGADHVGAGPAISLSFLITAFGCAFCALCYAEFASLVPIAGSAYTYSYATLGELIAWIIGWDLIIEYGVGNVAVAIGWAGYFHQLCQGLGIHIPAWLATDYRSAMLAAQAVADAGGTVVPDNVLAYAAWQNHPVIWGIPIIFNSLAAGIIVFITWLLCLGIKESANTNNLMVGLKLVILVLFIGIGAFYVKPENWTPFIPNGFAGIWSGASLVFFAYIGFDAVSTAAEECHEPARTMPIGIIGSLLVCTIFYVGTAIVLTGLIRWDQLSVPDPLAVAMQKIGHHTLAGIISMGACIAMTSVLLVFQLGQTRIFFSMARDGLLPARLAKVHPKYKTPVFSTILTGIAVGVVSAFTNINEMIELCNIGTLFAFILVCAGIIILRRTDPHHPRVFKTPLVPWVPLIGIAICLFLMRGLPLVTWIRFIVWLIVGLVIYFCYGFRHSRLHKESKC